MSSLLDREPKRGQIRADSLGTVRKKTKVYFDVLSLAMMELIFFIGSHMVLWFGFVTKTALLTHQCFSCCLECLHGAKAFSAPRTDAQQVGWGWARAWEESWLGQLTQTNHRDVLHCITSCSAIKMGWGAGVFQGVCCSGIVWAWVDWLMVIAFASLLFSLFPFTY